MCLLQVRYLIFMFLLLLYKLINLSGTKRLPSPLPASVLKHNTTRKIVESNKYLYQVRDILKKRAENVKEIKRLRLENDKLDKDIMECRLLARNLRNESEMEEQDWMATRNGKIYNFILLSKILYNNLFLFLDQEIEANDDTLCTLGLLDY